MSEEIGFSLEGRGGHSLAGRTVLQVVPALADHGADRTAIDVAAALAEVGARPLVAAPHGRLVSELQAVGGVWLDFPSASQNPIVMLLAARRLRKLIEGEQVDLVHARSRRAAWMALPATRAAKVAFVTSLNQISPTQSPVAQRYNAVMAKGDVVIAPSDFAAAAIVAA